MYMSSKPMYTVYCLAVLACSPGIKKHVDGAIKRGECTILILIPVKDVPGRPLGTNFKVCESMLPL